MAVAQGGVFLDGDQIHGAHAGHAVTQFGDLADEGRPISGLHRSEIFGGRFAATGDGLRGWTGAFLISLLEVVEAGDAFGFAVGEPELQTPVDLGDVELMVGLDLLDDETALRRLLGERDFESFEVGVGDTQAVAVDGKHAVFGFDGRVGLVEGAAQFVESGIGGLDLASEASGSLPGGGGLSLEFTDELLVLLGFDAP